MTTPFQSLLSKLLPASKRIFLTDAAGAFLTAFLLMAVLTPLEQYFGMPRKWLYPLSGIATGFAVYSLCCYYFSGQKWSTLLKLIAVANLLYCCLTLTILFLYSSLITILGWAYFILETAAVSTLAITELKIAGRVPAQGKQ